MENYKGNIRDDNKQQLKKKKKKGYGSTCQID